jgi:hypothetical protein
MRNPPALRLLAAILLLMMPAVCGRAQVVINEIVSAASERLLQWDSSGVPRLGNSPPWHHPNFADSSWRTGASPFGFGTITNGPAYSTDLGTQMLHLTPSLYLRHSFNVSTNNAARTDQLQLVIDYNDGFICYVNGVEVTRRWAGPRNQFHYHDQPAYRPNVASNATATTGFYTETINLGPANTLLQPGANLIAIHAMNVDRANPTLLMRPALRISGIPEVQVVASNQGWRYLPGLVEPSGTLYDPALIFSGKLSVPWATTTFDDSEWSIGQGPIGAGTATGLGTNVPGVINQTPSIYLRGIFNATASQAASNNSMQLFVDYDDAFVAYINGVEVARANIGNPNTFTPSNALATTTRNNGTQITYTIDPPSRLLKEGPNVLAIQFHNVALGDPDMYLRADLRTSTGVTFFSNNQLWKYVPGLGEPVPENDEVTEQSPSGPDYANDWLELRNLGSSPVSLAGWSLTDSPNRPDKWVFPADVTLPAGGYLVVLCTSEDVDLRAAGGYLHTNFSLSRGGEYLALRDAEGNLIQDFSPGFPEGSTFHTYGRNANGEYVYFDTATPGAPNSGTESLGIVEDPVFSVAGGFHPTTQILSLSTSTPGATIRYTNDGREPTATTGILYNGQVSVGISSAIRARAFKAGFLPSKTVTQTYLINRPAAQRSLPAFMLTADPGRALYRPNGVFAIQNNNPTANYISGSWHAASDPSQYNTTNLRGRSAERLANMQLAYPDGRPGFSVNFGMRAAGSPFSRPRYQFEWLGNPDPNSVSPFPSNSLQKPQINAFFRNDYGGAPLEFPIFPGSEVTTFDNIRLRSGKNDISNPFVRDELTRRLFLDTGNVSPRGINATTWINGVYKGYYNATERPREAFFQRWYKSDKPWDVWVIAETATGDSLMLQELLSWVRNNPQSNLSNYLQSTQRIDVTNFIDYLIINIYEAMGDWPHNNYVAARERSPNGKFVFTIWDGEGSFGSFSTTVRENNFIPVTANSSAHSQIVSSNPGGESLSRSIRVLYSTLRDSPEFKLLFADRLQKHFFNGGALTDARILARKNELRDEMLPLIPSFSDIPFNNWINGVGNITRYTTSGTTNTPSRRQVLFNGYHDDTQGGVFIQPHFLTEGLFPSTRAPSFSPLGGSVPQGFQLTLSNPNPGGTIYFTIDGSDPRQLGGAIQGTPYSGPLTLNNPRVIKARVRTAGGEWSPLQEAAFEIISSETPPPYYLADGPFQFTSWAASSPAGSYPPNMIFQQSRLRDPGLSAAMSDPYPLAYDLSSQTRINGLGSQGISFINTGTTNDLVTGNDVEGRDLGAAVAGINTTSLENIRVSWTGGTIAPNVRDYAIRLQYRVGNAGPFLDVNDLFGSPVEYRRNPEAGHSERIGPVTLPMAANNKPYVQLRWKYHHLSGSSGTRAELRLDDIHIAGRAPGPSFAAWRETSFQASELTDPDISSPLAAPLGDGNTNLLKYALGIGPREPLAADSMQAWLEQEPGNRLRVRFRRDPRKFDIDYIVEATTDPTAGWPVILYHSGQQAALPNNDGDHMIISDTADSSQNPRRFIRLRVVAK